MRLQPPLFSLCFAVSLSCASYAQSKIPAPPAGSSHVPTYTAEGKINRPSDYREWVYLSSGLDMSYSPRVKAMADHSMFDNVFVNPEAYGAFKQTGHWPDKTMLVLEIRGAESNASINKAGISKAK